MRVCTAALSPNNHDAMTLTDDEQTDPSDGLIGVPDTQRHPITDVAPGWTAWTAAYVPRCMRSASCLSVSPSATAQKPQSGSPPAAWECRIRATYSTRNVPSTRYRG